MYNPHEKINKGPTQRKMKAQRQRGINSDTLNFNGNFSTIA